MPLAEVEGGAIHYEITGRGPPVILIAGLGGAASYWKPQVAALSQRYMLVLYDQEGTGRSSKRRTTCSVPQMAADLVGLMDHAGLKAAHCVGHAGGAAIAQEVALTNPSRVLSTVMFAGWAKVDPYFRRVMDIRGELLKKSGRLHYARAMPLFLNPPAWVSHNVTVLEEQEKELVDHLPPRDILLNRMGALCAYEPGEELRRVACSTLVCCAKDDHLTPVHCSEELARLIPKAQSYYFAWGGHAASQTVPAEFNAVVTSFLDATEGKQTWIPPVKQAMSS
ncbi:MAG: pyrimidine utilization protein D [Hyphomonadaceae bacterium]|nr:pyrimidine utilization protein D [Hyphomonadaceae bacterium]